MNVPRYRVEIVLETSAFIPLADVKDVPDGPDNLFGTVMSNYEHDPDSQILEFKVIRLPDLLC